MTRKELLIIILKDVDDEISMLKRVKKEKYKELIGIVGACIHCRNAHYPHCEVD